MSKENQHQAKLGLFVIVGVVLFILSMYFIGNKQNMFSKTIEIHAVFKDVNGLQKGNNVRFAGIDVGTIDKVSIINDTAIRVNMIIRDEVREFIKKDAFVTIGTDGLMGNKIVNISSGRGGLPVEAGDQLKVIQDKGMNAMMGTLGNTSENIEVISYYLLQILESIYRGEGFLGKAIMDSGFSNKAETALLRVNQILDKTHAMVAELDEVVNMVQDGEGTLGMLLTDTAVAGDFERAMANVSAMSATLEESSEKIKKLLDEENQGIVGKAMHDTTLVKKVYESLDNIEKGTADFHENMEALKHNILFRRYFKNKMKEEGKN